MPDYKDKKVAILGIGIEGIAVAKFLKGNYKTLTLLDQFSEEKILENASDENRTFLKELFVDPEVNKIFSEEYMNNLFDYDVVFRTPAISTFEEKIQEAKNKGTEITSQLKLFFDLCPAKIIGVTGTKGKGTTSSLIFEILKKYFVNKKEIFFAGNIGYPALDLLEKIKPEDLVVLELSNFQLMDLHKSPNIAVVTNLTEDHLDFHKDRDEYLDAKANILSHQTENDLTILNSKSTFPDKYLKDIKSEVLWFGDNGEKDQCVVIGDEVILDPKGEKITICNLSKIQLLGKHNLENIAAAALVANRLEVDNKTIIEVAKDFKGLPHRLEFVRELRGVRYINDSFATNPGPTMAAIKSFAQNKILILGGSSKGADFTELADIINSNNVSGVVLIGDEGKKINEVLVKSGYQGKVFSAEYDFKMAINQAQQIAKDGDYVIFSPACASFDMFKNYKDRGDKFKQVVNNLS